MPYKLRKAPARRNPISSKGAFNYLTDRWLRHCVAQSGRSYGTNPSHTLRFDGVWLFSDGQRFARFVPSGMGGLSTHAILLVPHKEWPRNRQVAAVRNAATAWQVPTIYEVTQSQLEELT